MNEDDLTAAYMAGFHDGKKAAQQQEPVAWLWELTGEVTTDPDRADGMWLPLYTSPPASKPWVGLTDEDLFDIASVNFGEPDLQLFIEMGRLVQEELKEKNT